MLMKKILFTALASLALLTACDKGDFTKSDSGLEYILHTKNEGPRVQKGDFVSFHYALSAKDSVIQSTFNFFPGQTQVSGQDQPGIRQFEEALMLCTAKDSITIQVTAGDLFAAQQMPPSLTKEEKVKLTIKVLEVKSKQDYYKELSANMQQQYAKMDADMKDQMPKDAALIAEYAKKNSLATTATASGLNYVITQEGSGENPQMGDLVKVHYTGTLLDGTKFDSSLDRQEPFQFQLGTGSVIRGWDEGIALLKPGAKATLLLPSHLAYGAQGAGEVIKPYSVLRFEVELLKVEK